MAKSIMIKRGAVFILFLIFFCSFASATTLTVGSSQTYKTIQSAVNAAASGDVIKVYPGTYHETVIINKNDITVEAQDPRNPPEIDGADQNFNPTWENVKTYQKDGKYPIYKTSYSWTRAQPTDEEYRTYAGGTSKAPMQVYEDDHLLRGYRNRHDPDYEEWTAGPYRKIDDLDYSKDERVMLPSYFQKQDINISGRFLYDEANGELFVWGEAEDDPSKHDYNIPVLSNLMKITNAQNIMIRNIVFKHSSFYALTIQSSNNVKIENNYFIKNHYSVYVLNSKNIVISKNFIQEKGFWERYWYEDSKGTLLWSWAIKVDNWGIVNSNIDISENIVNNCYGLVQLGSDEVKVHGNIISHGVSALISPATRPDIPSPFNIQIYNNVIHHSDLDAFGLSNMEKGPVYIFRNVIYRVQDLNRDGGMTLEQTQGKAYVYQNTLALAGSINQHPYNHSVFKNTVYRNNIFQLRSINHERYWIYGKDYAESETLAKYWNFFPFVYGPDTDYNLYSRHPGRPDINNAIAQFANKWYFKGQFNMMKKDTGFEPNGLEAEPLFVNDNINTDNVFSLKYDTFSDMNYKDVINQGYDNVYNQKFPALYNYFNVQLNSPAIDRGVDLDPSWPDIATIADGKSDIGAVEYGGTTPPPNQENIIQNPDFESGTTSWTFFTDGAGTFTSASPGFSSSNSAKISITTLGTNTQLFQYNLPLQPVTEYELSFDAYSNTERDLEVYLQKHDSPYTNYGLSKQFDLTNSWKHFSYIFTTSGFSSAVTDTRLRFWFSTTAQAGDEFRIDNVILKPYGDDSNCIHKSEIPPCDGKVKVNELMVFINRWKNNEIGITISDIINSIGYWKNS